MGKERSHLRRKKCIMGKLKGHYGRC